MVCLPCSLKTPVTLPIPTSRKSSLRMFLLCPLLSIQALKRSSGVLEGPAPLAMFSPHRPPTVARAIQALTKGRAVKRGVGEVILNDHLVRVGACGLGEGRINAERLKPVAPAGLVVQIESAPLFGPELYLSSVAGSGLNKEFCCSLSPSPPDLPVLGSVAFASSSDSSG